MNKRMLFCTLLALVGLSMLVGTASATAPTEVSGTYSIVDVYEILGARPAGNNCILEVDAEYPFSGDLEGTAYAHFKAVIHGPCETAAPFANREMYHAKGTFVGTVLGQAGTFDFTYEGRGWPAEPGEQAVAARIVVLTGTGDLENLHGVLEVSYIMGETFDSYTGQVHFDP